MLSPLIQLLSEIFSGATKINLKDKSFDVKELEIIDGQTVGVTVDGHDYVMYIKETKAKEGE